MAKKLPTEIAKFFKEQGARGGKIGGSDGGKIAAAKMTPEQRRERALKASQAAALARTKRAAAKIAPTKAVKKSAVKKSTKGKPSPGK